MSGSRGARKKKVHEDEHPDERWMASYMDMITVLMCMFIVLYAMSTVDQDKYVALRNSLATGFGQTELGAIDSASGTVVPVDQVTPEGEGYSAGDETDMAEAAASGEAEAAVGEGLERLAGIAHELGDGAEAAEAPGGLGIGERLAQERRDGVVRGRARMPVLLPVEEVAALARPVVERIGVLDERVVRRRLREPPHQASAVAARSAASSAATIGEKSDAFRLAPPTSAPSTSGMAKIAPAFDALTDPP